MSESYWLPEQQGNFSNDKKDTFDPKKRYIGIRLQQGVPLLDRDWNELEDLRRYTEVTTFENFIGNGIPDEKGFEIQAFDPPKQDFKILKGLCLVQGFLAFNEPEKGEDYIAYTDQPQHTDLSELEDGQEHTVYIDIWLEEITAKQDPALQNKQDIDIETCVRHKLLWLVRVTEKGGDYPKENFHHYYDLAKIKWDEGIRNIKVTKDLRTTNLKLALVIQQIGDIKKWIEFLEKLKKPLETLIEYKRADQLHWHSKLVAPGSTPDPALAIDDTGNSIIEKNAIIKGNASVRTIQVAETAGINGDTVIGGNLDVKGNFTYEGDIQFKGTTTINSWTFTTMNDRPCIFCPDGIIFCDLVIAHQVSEKFLGGGVPGTALTPVSTPEAPVSAAVEKEIYLNGSGRLANGKANITFEAESKKIIDPSVPYKVLLTPTGECNGLCVIKKEEKGFTVKELQKGENNTGFDWLVIAKRK